MRLGYIGLGKMGLSMVQNALEHKHKLHVYDPNRRAMMTASNAGALIFGSAIAVVQSLRKSRLVWIMVPHKFVDSVLKEITPYLEKGDTIIDGGNSLYTESTRRAKALEKKGINYLDVGVSGGPAGARHGACMMIGGKKKIFKKYEKFFKDLTVSAGYGYMGDSGSGHFVKMVHNGIEYGMMQAIAEGFSVMKKYKREDLDLKKIADVYNHGSVIESSLIGWMKNAYEKFGEDLKGISGSASATGEGAWTIEEAHRLGVRDEVIHESLRARKRSQKRPNYQGQIISALRNQFGGHSVKNTNKKH